MIEFQCLFFLSSDFYSIGMNIILKDEANQMLSRWYTMVDQNLTVFFGNFTSNDSDKVPNTSAQMQPKNMTASPPCFTDGC